MRTGDSLKQSVSIGDSDTNLLQNRFRCLREPSLSSICLQSMCDQVRAVVARHLQLMNDPARPLRVTLPRSKGRPLQTEQSKKHHTEQGTKNSYKNPTTRKCSASWILLGWSLFHRERKKRNRIRRPPPTLTTTTSQRTTNSSTVHYNNRHPQQRSNSYR